METTVFYILGLLFLANFVWLVSLTLRQNRLLKRGRELFSDSKKGDVYELVNDYLVKVRKVESEENGIKNDLKEVLSLVKNSFQKIGVVRYNPFKEVGGDLSFSVALLDFNDSGIVITNIHSREGDRVYAKSVKNGESEHNLSAEEKEAIKKAKK